MSSDDGRERAFPVGRRILVAEDNPVNRRVATALLELSGHDVHCVGNGREALDAVVNGGFDLVLMDLEMPELDGIATTRLIRAREKGGTSRLPIVALTARRSASDRARCLEAGMDDYLTKPLDPAALGAAIARLTDDGAAPFDVDEALRLLGGDRGLLFEVADLLREDAVTVMGQMERALERGDALGVEKAAHRLKGSLLNVAAHHAAAAALAIESAAREVRLEDIGPLVPCLARELARLDQAFRRLS